MSNFHFLVGHILTYDDMFEVDGDWLHVFQCQMLPPHRPSGSRRRKRLLHRETLVLLSR